MFPNDSLSSLSQSFAIDDVRSLEPWNISFSSFSPMPKFMYEEEEEQQKQYSINYFDRVD